MQQSYRYGNFREILAAFGLVSLLLETPDDYGLATRRLLEWLAEQNVRYAEITLSAGVILWKKQPVESIVEAIAAATSEAGARLGLRINWIFDAVRQFGLDQAREVLNYASRFRSQGVVAFGIGGDELRGPADLFTALYREARDLGLHVTAHAGETVGPESVRQAVELLGAERIGHALSARRDSSVMQMLRDQKIPIEVCPTSNVATGVLARLEDHPLPQFLEAGLMVTLNSDDPAMFGTSLEREFLLAAKTFSLSRDQLIRLCENAIRASFLPENERQSLFQDLHSALSPNIEAL
jgi:adenosine deaminase/aminodeoxyfutalosine deaminase